MKIVSQFTSVSKFRIFRHTLLNILWTSNASFGDLCWRFKRFTCKYFEPREIVCL